MIRARATWRGRRPRGVESSDRLDRARNGAAEGTVRDDSRVLAGTTGDHDYHVFGRRHLREQRVVVGDRVHPARPVLDTPHAAELERSKRQPRMLEDEALELWEKYQPTFDPSETAVSATVARMPAAVVDT